MPTIHLIANDKGGVGKSFFAKTKIQYCLDKKYAFVAVETDRCNPDVAAVYPKVCDFAVFSEDEKQAAKADSIFEHAIEKPVVVSLPAQADRSVRQWIEGNQLFTIGKEYQVDFCKWFVCSGQYDSVKLLINSLEFYQGRMRHIVVRNWGKCDDWLHVDNDKELEKLVKKYRVKVIDLPKLPHAETYLIDKNRLNFAQARELKELKTLGKQRVVNFLNATYQAIDSTGEWHESTK